MPTPHHDCPHLTRRRTTNAALAVLLLCALAGLGPWPAAAQAARRDAGTGLSYRLAGTNGPLVVFESATAEPMANWEAVTAALGDGARTLVYDRLGTGDSAPLATPTVQAQDVAARLHRLLADLGERGPVILVGHSIGGLYAQAFARGYPQAIAGVVLVDAASPLEPPGVFIPSVPPTPGTTAAAEESGVSASVAALNAGPAFPPVPLVVLAASRHNDTPEREALWQEVQARTAALSPKGRRVVVESGHFVQRERPEAVVEAIRAVMGAVTAQ